MNGYTILTEKPHARWGSVICAVLAFLYIAVMQFLEVRSGAASFSTHFLFAYVPAILMILAGLMRSYLLFLLANVYYTLRLVVLVILDSMKEGAYTTFDVLDMLIMFALLALAGALCWQVLLFFAGHADHVALTHTSLLFVILCAVMLFSPALIHTFLEDMYVIDTWDALLLGASFLSFAAGIKKKPTADEK